MWVAFQALAASFETLIMEHVYYTYVQAFSSLSVTMECYL